MTPAERAAKAATMTSFKYPNQFEGMVDGAPFYFRARNGHWTLQVGRIGEADAVNALVIASGADERAGAWEEDEARAVLAKAMEEYFGRDE